MDIFNSYPSSSNLTDFKYANAFCITGCVGLIRHWMSRQFRETPEHMARLAYNLVVSALTIKM
jgi:hypothetical protein